MCKIEISQVRNKRKKIRNKAKLQTWFLLLLLMLAIFISEFFLTILLEYLSTIPSQHKPILDASLLLLLLAPIFYIAYQQIIKRIMIEQTFQEERDKFKAVFDVSGDALRIIDSNVDSPSGFTVTMVNSRMATLLGLPIKQQTGKKCYEILPSPHCHTENCTVKRILRGEPAVEEELLRPAKGKKIWMHHIATPMYESNGKIVAVVEAFRDITERKEMEEELKKTNQELQNTINNLKAMQAQLIQREKLASIGQLAAGIAHEMNNPVGFVASNMETLKGYIDVLQRLLLLYRKLLSETQDCSNQEKIEDIRKEIQELEEKEDIDFILNDLSSLLNETMEGLQRLTEIIQSLREFSRVDQIGDFCEYNLNEAVKKTLIITRNEYKYVADVKLDLGDIPPIYCNPSQVNEVIMNTIVNAAHAVKEKWQEKKGLIHIKTFQEGNYVCYQIEDNGIGIPDEIKDKIFDPFFTTKEVGKGTGLGLNIVYDIVVNKHKGKISVDSEVGKWTRFTIKFPIRPEKEN